MTKRPDAGAPGRVSHSKTIEEDMKRIADRADWRNTALGTWANECPGNPRLLEHASSSRRAMTDAAYTATVRLLPDGHLITLSGRLAWAFLMLKDAGETGCTPLDNPGPRWSGYIHKLRTVYGLPVETITVVHGGPFAGRHARYVLRSEVEILHRSDRPERSVAA